MKKKIYRDNLVKYIGFFLIPMILVGVVLTIFVSVRAYRRQIESASTSARQVAASFGVILNNVMIESDQFVNNPSISTALHRITSDNFTFYYRDYVSMRTINASMLSIMSTYDSIAAISFYTKEHPYYYSSFTGRTLLTEEKKKDLMEKYQSIEGTRHFTYRRSQRDERYFTVSRLLSLNNDMILLTLNADKLTEWIGRQIGEENPLAYFYSADGMYLFGCNESLSQTELIQDISLTDAENAWSSIGGKDYYRVVSNQNAYDLYVVYLTPKSAIARSVLENLLPCAIVVLTGFLAAVMLAIYTSRRETNRLMSMINLFQAAEQGVYPEKPEKKQSVAYDMLMDNLLYVFLRGMEMREEREQIEKSLLQLQINPHFLFNALQNLSFQIRRGETAEKEIEEINALSEILRYALTNPEKRVSLQEEITYLKKYVLIQEMRFNNNLIVYYDIDEELLDTLWVHRLILQPIVENSIVHGMFNVEQRCYVNVNVQRERDQILFQVEDNGKGMSAERLRQLRKQMQRKEYYQHIGLTNVNRRLILYYGQTAGLHIQSEPGVGTTISFMIPEIMLKSSETNKEEIVHEMTP